MEDNIATVTDLSRTHVTLQLRSRAFYAPRMRHGAEYATRDVICDAMCKMRHGVQDKTRCPGCDTVCRMRHVVQDATRCGMAIHRGMLGDARTGSQQ